MKALDLSSLYIYVIDDDDTVRSTTVEVLKSLGGNVLGFASAESFLRDYDGSPGIIVCDVRMPGMSGIGLQKLLADRDIFIPVVLMTGFCRTSLIVEAVRSGATTVLEKPFNQEELLLALHQAINDYRAGIDAHRSLQNARIGLAALSDSEWDVLRLLKAGHANKDIAAVLDVSVRTVVLRRKRILEKMRADSLIGLFQQLAMVDVADARQARRRLLSKSGNIALV